MTEIELLEKVLENRKSGKPSGHGLLFDGDRLPDTEITADDIWWDDYKKYSLAPRTHVVNEFEVPAPESIEPEGKEFFFPDHTKTCRYNTIRSYDTHISWHRNLFKNKQVFLTAEDAIDNQRAQAFIDPSE